jgi:hypothetical protein
MKRKEVKRKRKMSSEWVWERERSKIIREEREKQMIERNNEFGEN